MAKPSKKPSNEPPPARSVPLPDGQMWALAYAQAAHAQSAAEYFFVLTRELAHKLGAR